MNRASRPLLAALAAGLLLFGVSCADTAPAAPGDAPAAGGSSATATAPVAATPETIAWTNNLCGVLQKSKETLSTEPKLDTSSLAASVASVSAYFSQMTTSFDSAIADLKGIGPSPVPGGDDTVNKVADEFGQYRDIFAKMKTNIDTTKPTDGASLQAALAPLADIKKVPSPSSGLQNNPQLSAAVRQAPNCAAFTAPPATPAPATPAN